MSVQPAAIRAVAVLREAFAPQQAALHPDGQAAFATQAGFQAAVQATLQPIVEVVEGDMAERLGKVLFELLLQAFLEAPAVGPFEGVQLVLAEQAVDRFPGGGRSLPSNATSRAGAACSQRWRGSASSHRRIGPRRAASASLG